MYIAGGGGGGGGGELGACIPGVRGRLAVLGGQGKLVALGSGPGKLGAPCKPVLLGCRCRLVVLAPPWRLVRLVPLGICRSTPTPSCRLCVDWLRDQNAGGWLRLGDRGTLCPRW